MAEERQNSWNIAGKAGLVMALVCIAFELAGALIPGSAQSLAGSALVSLTGIALKIAKIFLISYILLRFMKQYVANQGNHSPFLFGVAASALSSILLSALVLFVFKYMLPDEFLSLMPQVMEEAIAKNPQISAAQAEQSFSLMMNNMPSIMFLGSIIYLNIWGLVLSAILQGMVRPSNPFKETEETDND